MVGAPVIGDVLDNGVAQRAGLEPGDRVRRDRWQRDPLLGGRRAPRAVRARQGAPRPGAAQRQGVRALPHADRRDGVVQGSRRQVVAAGPRRHHVRAVRAAGRRDRRAIAGGARRAAHARPRDLDRRPAGAQLERRPASPRQARAPHEPRVLPRQRAARHPGGRAAVAGIRGSRARYRSSIRR